jgi:2-polyprenyl-3-methyl-5-hydroxy-6-metoxy-1,4-benzoquinol methylase
MDISGYVYDGSEHTDAHSYLLPTLQKLLKEYLPDPSGKRLLDLGCGNGSVTKYVKGLGYQVEGIDPSIQGIEIARLESPDIKFYVGDTSKSIVLEEKYDLIYSLEVIEHVYDPYSYMEFLASNLSNNGIAIISTPYHGYVKNLVMALTGKLDAHFTALWKNGHIKFWSKKTLGVLSTTQNLILIRFTRVGRIPILAKSMVIVLKK